MREPPDQSPTASAAHPYRDALASSLAAALASGLIVALFDIIVARGRCAGDCPTAGFALITIGLYALPALLIGVGLGVVSGAWSATYGSGSLGRGYRRLRDERALDINVSAGLLAGALVMVLFAGFATIAAMKLVAGVERQSVGALLLGCALTVALPIFALLALPAYRITRQVARILPRIGPIPAAIVLVVVAALGAIVLVMGFIFTRLDWRALNLGIFVVVAAFAALLLAWHGLWYGPLAQLRQRIPRRGAIVAATTALALAWPVATLRGTPSTPTLILLSEHSPGASVLLGIGRALRDGDGDGYSAFLGGPDCDDGNGAVHPDAKEIAGNGIDDNCIGGDRAASAPPPVVDPAVEAPGDDEFAFSGNVLVITIDTVRADRLGIAGYRRDDKSLTPRLDEFARSATYFTQTYAQAPNTPRSFPSIFSSRYPSQVVVDKQFKNYANLGDENLMMFEVLSAGGFHTTGFSSHFYFSPDRGIRQGFVEYDNEGAKDIAGSNADIASPRIVPKVEARLAELAQAQTKFVMFVHLFEPHSTYVKHPEYPITLRKIPGLVQKYDYEIAFVDTWLGRILDAVDANGLTDNTMVVILSDHGEAFGVHRVAGQSMFFHGQTLYDELLRVPVLMRLPGTEPHQVDDPTMLIDVAPTIVDAVGLDIPASFAGRSLLGYLRGRDMPQRPAFAELLPAPSWNHSAKMMVSADGRHKLYYRTSDKRFELYDLQEDPEERRNLYSKQSELAKQLEDSLIEWIEVDLQR